MRLIPALSLRDDIQKGYTETMRYFLTFALATILCTPAFAQDAAGGGAAETTVSQDAASTDEQRVALATRMHEIWPVSARVEEAIAVVSEEVPSGEREAFRARMRKAIDRGELERESVKAMAQVFTEGELQAMVNFYGSPEGRSVSAKTEDYMALLQPVMIKMLDSALLKMKMGDTLQSTPDKPTPVTP